MCPANISGNWKNIISFVFYFYGAAITTEIQKRIFIAQSQSQYHHDFKFCVSVNKTPKKTSNSITCAM